MTGEDGDELLQRAESIADLVLSRAGDQTKATAEWFHGGTESATASLFKVDQNAMKIRLNRGFVETWFDELPRNQALERFLAMAFRASSALLFSPPPYEWMETAELHIRSEQDQGLDESYARAFQAANLILESHRLDQRLLALVPDKRRTMAELVRFDLEGHPAFDIYPRAAIIMGRPDLPKDLARPAFDEFVEKFDVEEADALAETLGAYVALDAQDVNGMVELTARLVFQAFPEAMGLGRFDDDELTSEDVWEFRGRLPDDGSIAWSEFERFVTTALTAFTGEAGLDYGDALLIVIGDDVVGGPRIGMWARSGDISADVVGIPLVASALEWLLARGWEQFENEPESLHKEVPVDAAGELALEIVWILHVIIMMPSTAGLTLWGRGPVLDAADGLGWSLGDID